MMRPIFKILRGGPPEAGVVLGVVLAVAAAAPVGGAEPDNGTGWPTFYRPVEVPLVSVDVLVTDEDGQPVAGLRPDDFEVRQDGVPMTITNFYAAPGVSAATIAAPGDAPVAEPPAEDRELHLAFYLDETSIDQKQRRATMNHLREFLVRPLPSGVHAMVARYDGSLEIRSEFTDRTDQLIAALDAERGRGRSTVGQQAELLLREMQDLGGASLFTAPVRRQNVPGSADGGQIVHGQNPDSFLPQIHALARSLQVRNRASVDALREFVDLLAAVPGRKGVIWIGGGLETRVAENLFTTWERMFPRRANTMGFNAMTASREYSVATDVRDLMRHAASNRVTFLTLGSTAIRGTATVSPEISSLSTLSGAEVVDVMSTDDALAAMSTLPSGRRGPSGAGLADQLDYVLDELNSYYSLAYEPPTPGDGEYHRIRVEVGRPELRVRHRDGYQDYGTTEPVAERTLTAAVLGYADNPMGIAVERQPVEPLADGRYTVPMLIRVPIGELVLLPDGPRHTAEVSLFTAVRDGDGRLSEVHSRRYPFEVPNDQMKTAIHERAGLVVGLVMNAGAKRVAFSVRDERSHIASTVVVDLTIGG